MYIFYRIYHHPPQRWTVFSLSFVMFLLSRDSIRRINVWSSFNLLFSSYFNEICSIAHKIIVMVNWLFKISYTPVGPETYSSGLFMHKIPLCEALSKCVMTGVSPEVFLQSLSAWLPLQAVLQLLFLTKLWSGLLQCRNADTTFFLNNENHSAATYEIKVHPVWKRADLPVLPCQVISFCYRIFTRNLRRGKKILWFPDSPCSFIKWFQCDSPLLFAPQTMCPTETVILSQIFPAMSVSLGHKQGLPTILSNPP